MFKLINIILIFVFLQFIIPIFKNVLPDNEHSYNIIAAVVIGIIQFIYGYVPYLYDLITKSGDNKCNENKVTIIGNLVNSMTTSIIVLGGSYLINNLSYINTIVNNINKLGISIPELPILSDFQDNIEFTNQLKSPFITLLISYYIIIKILLTS